VYTLDNGQSCTKAARWASHKYNQGQLGHDAFTFKKVFATPVLARHKILHRIEAKLNHKSSGFARDVARSGLYSGMDAKSAAAAMLAHTVRRPGVGHSASSTPRPLRAPTRCLP
jgi:hypothetical protein